MDETTLGALKNGRRVTRDAYNPTGDPAGTWLFLVPAATAPLEEHALAEAAPELRAARLEYAPFIAIKQDDGTIAPWYPKPDDILAEDWYILPGPRDEQRAAAPAVHYTITPRRHAPA